MAQNFLSDIHLGDNIYIRLGSKEENGSVIGDFTIRHSGANMFLNNSTGSLVLKNTADDKGIAFQADDGNGGVATYFELEADQSTYDTSNSVIEALYTTWGDNSRIALGTSRDLQIYHDGTNSYIDNARGDLYVRNDKDDADIIFQSDDGSGGLATYFYLDGGSVNIRFVKHARFTDGYQLQLGNSADMAIFHSGTNSFIQNATGDLYIDNDKDDGDIIFRSDNGSGGKTTYFALDGGLERNIFYKTIRINGAGAGHLKTDANGDISIDTSVVDGSGTANDVVMWSDSNTLTDAPISISGNDSTFAGSITTTSTTGIKVDTTANALLELDGASNSTEAIIFRHSGTEVSRLSHSNSTNLVFSTGSSTATALTLDSSQNATFSGKVAVGSADPEFALHLSNNVGSGGLNSGVMLEMRSSTATDPVGMRFVSQTGGSTNYMQNLYDGANLKWKHWSGSAYVDKITFSNTGNATFAGYVDAGNFKINGAQGTDGQVLTSTGSGVAWEDVSGGTIDGSGTANDVVMWSDSDTLTDAPIAISGNNATFAGNVSLTAGSLSITADGSNATSLSESDTGNFLIDTVGNIILDADVGNIALKDGGSEFGRFSNDSQSLIIQNVTADKDIIFKGKDGSSNVTALTLDMSEGGNATFAGNISLADGWTLQNVSGGYAKFSSWVNISNTGFYTTEDMYFDLDDSSSRFVVRGVNNAELFEIDTSDSNSATFAGDVTVNGGYLTVNGSQTDEFIKVTNSNNYTGIWMNDSHTNNGWLLLSGYTDAASPGDFAIREYGVQTSLVIKQTTGNIGVGTVSPDEKLHIEKAGNTTKTRLQIQGGNKGFTLGKTQQDADYAHLKPINAGSPAVLRVMANTNDADSYIEVWHTDYEANTSNYARGMFYIDGNNNVHLRSNAAGTYTAGSVFIGAGASTSALEINNSGNAIFTSSVTAGTFKTSGSLTGIVINGQEIYANEDYNGNDGSIRLNRFGYQGGQTKFRDVVIYDGKGSIITHIDGSDKSATFKGDIILDDDTTESPYVAYIDNSGANSSDIEYRTYSTNGNFLITRTGNGGADIMLSGHATDYTSSTTTFAGNVTVGGNLTVTGTSTAVNVEDLNVEQGEITLNYAASSDTSSSAGGAGIRIQDAVDASNDATILWDQTENEFDFSHGGTFAGGVTISQNSAQLRLKRADGTDDDWRFYSWGSGLNIYPQTASTIFFGRDGQTADVNVWNGDFIVDTDTLFVDASANSVGVGTTNPDQKFHVEFANTDTSFSGGSGGAWGSEGIRIENTSSTADTMAMLHLRNGDADIHMAGIRKGTNDSDLGFFFEGTQKVLFENDGSATFEGEMVVGASNMAMVGIGFTTTNLRIKPKSALANGRIFRESNYLIYDSPSAGHKFAVAGNATTNVALTIDSSQNATFAGQVETKNNAGIYSFSDTVNAGSTEDIFKLSNSHGAQAFRVTFVCNTSGFSVAKTFEVVHQFSGTPVFAKVVDTGAYSNNDFSVAFANDSDTGVKCTITNSGATINADIVTTVFLGGSPTDITVTEL